MQKIGLILACKQLILKNTLHVILIMLLFWIKTALHLLQEPAVFLLHSCMLPLPSLIHAIFCASAAIWVKAPRYNLRP